MTARGQLMSALTPLATAEIGAESARETTGMATTSAEKVATAQIGSTEKLAGERDKLERDLAATTDATERFRIEKQLEAVNAQITSAEKISTQQVGSAESIALQNRQLERERMVLSEKLANATNDIDRQRLTVELSALDEQIRANKANEAYQQATLAESGRQFDIATTEGRTQFFAALTQTALDQKLNREQTAALASAQLTESARQFDLSSADGRSQFAATLAEGARQFGITEDNRIKIATDALLETGRQFDLTRADEMDRFTKQLAESARQFNLDDATRIKLASDALAEGTRQFDLTRTDQSAQFAQNLDESIRQFNLNQQQAVILTAMTLNANAKLTAQQINVTHMGNLMNLLIEGSEALLPEDGAAIITAAMSMGDFGATLTADQRLEARTLLNRLGAGAPEDQALRNMLSNPSIWHMSPIEVAALPAPEAETRSQLDMNHDGVVDIMDYLILQSETGL